MKRKIWIDIICMLFIILFVYAAFNKLFTRPLFAAQMRKAHLLEAISEPMSYIVPIVEILISILLISTRYKLKALFAATGLMVLFTIYIATILLINTEAPCGCGGIIQDLSWPAHMAMNILFVSLGLIGIKLQRKVAETKTSVSVYEQKIA